MVDMKKVVRLALMSSVLWKVGAMENNENKVITFDNFFKYKKIEDRVNTMVTTYEKLRKSDSDIYDIGKLKSLSDYRRILEDNKKDILFPLTFGNNERKKIYTIGKSFCDFFLKSCTLEEKDKAANYLLLTLRKNRNEVEEKFYNNYKEHFATCIEEFRKSCKDCDDINKNKDLDYLRLLMLNTVKENNEYLFSIGRRIINREVMKIDLVEKIVNYNGIPKLRLRGDGPDLAFDLVRMEEGEMNCTINSALIYMFLKLNSFECIRVSTKDHSFVLAKVFDENNKRINFVAIDLVEGETIDATSFFVQDIVSFKDIFKGFAYWQDTHNGPSNENNISYNVNDKEDSYNLKEHKGLITPIYKYYEDFVEYIHQAKDEKIPLENITYHLNGLKYALKIFIDQKYTNGTDQWKIKFLPRLGNKCTIFLNLNDLGKPSYSDLMYYDWEDEEYYRPIEFSSLSKPGELVKFMVADIELPDNCETSIIDCNLEIKNYDFKNYLTKYENDVIAKKMKIKNDNLNVIRYEVINNENKVVKTGESRVIEIS